MNTHEKPERSPDEDLIPFQESSVELTILMPCLDEAETLAACVSKALTFLRTAGISGEVLIADNGSTDGSQEIGRAAGARVVQIREKGYGSALRGGIEAAKGRYIIMGDADDSYDFLAAAPFLEKMREGCQLVMGNRFLGGIQPGAMPFLHRYLGNPVLSFLGRLFFGGPIGDFHCGLRGFDREAIRALGLHTPGMEFATEMVVKASTAGLRIGEVPTTLSPDGRSRPPHLRTWRDGWRHLRFMLLYSPRWLFLYPGLLLMVLGFGVGFWVWLAPRKIGSLTLDVHTLLFCGLAGMLGFQAVCFAVFTKAFAIRQGLLPPDARFQNILRFARLEVGLILGGFLLAMGFWMGWQAFSTWQHVSFGPLNPSETLRLVIPSFLAIDLGAQVCLTSFFVTVLGLGARQAQ